jgi:hypothetical protein
LKKKVIAKKKKTRVQTSKTGKKPINYINNADLLVAIVEHQKAVKKHEKAGTIPPPPPDYIGKCILQICNKLSTRYNFVDYSYRDLFVGEAIERCVMAIRTFDAKKTTHAFNYLTMVAFRAMQKVINVEKHQNYIKHKYFASTFASPGNLEGEPHDVQDDDYTNRIISEYEEKLQAKKNKEGPKK